MRSCYVLASAASLQLWMQQHCLAISAAYMLHLLEAVKHCHTIPVKHMIPYRLCAGMQDVLLQRRACSADASLDEDLGKKGKKRKNRIEAGRRTCWLP